MSNLLKFLLIFTMSLSFGFANSYNMHIRHLERVLKLVEQDNYYTELDDLQDLAKIIITKMEKRQILDQNDTIFLKAYVNFLQKDFKGTKYERFERISPYDFALAKRLLNLGEISKELFYKLKERYELNKKFLVDKFIESDDKELSYGYFAPVEGCDAHNEQERGFCCMLGNNECLFKLSKPIKGKGEIYITNDYNIGKAEDSDGSFYYVVRHKPRLEFISNPTFALGNKAYKKDKTEVKFNITGTIKNFLKQIKTPEFIDENLAGHIKYVVEYEINNQKIKPCEYIYCDKDTTNVNFTSEAAFLHRYEFMGDSIVFLKKLKVLEGWDKKIYDKEHYERESGDYKAFLNTKSSKLLDKPNGKTIAHILNDYGADKFSIFVLGERNEKTKPCYKNPKSPPCEIYYERMTAKSEDGWVRVLYFPPHTEYTSGAMIGYLHESELSITH